jgi:hypothetical protein
LVYIIGSQIYKNGLENIIVPGVYGLKLVFVTNVQGLTSGRTIFLALFVPFKAEIY